MVLPLAQISQPEALLAGRLTLPTFTSTECLREKLNNLRTVWRGKDQSKGLLPAAQVQLHSSSCNCLAKITNPCTLNQFTIKSLTSQQYYQVCIINVLLVFPTEEMFRISDLCIKKSNLSTAVSALSNHQITIRQNCDQ
jgi:hypothetical protein